VGLHILPQPVYGFGDPTVRFQFAPRTVTSLAWRSDGALLAVGTHWGISLLDADFSLKTVIDLPRGRWEVVWHSSLPLLAAISDDPCKVFIWQTAIHNSGIEFTDSEEYDLCGTLRWSNSDEHFAILDYHKLLSIVDKNSARHILSLLYGVTDFAWQNRGNQLAFTTDNNILLVWDTAARRMMRRINDAGQRVEWSPDDQQLATVIVSGTKMTESPSDGPPTIPVRGFNAIRFWDASDGQMIDQIVVQDDLLTAHDIDWLSGELVGGFCEYLSSFNAYELCIWDRAGNMVMNYSLGGGSSGASYPVWSPDRQRFFSFLFWHGTSLRAAILGETSIFIGKNWEISDAAWAPDSRHITVVDNAGALYHIQFEPPVYF
jgi:hypothetical protein